jgi:hypothetical protein
MVEAGKLNPRPKSATPRSLHAYSVRLFPPLQLERARNAAGKSDGSLHTERLKSSDCVAPGP